MASEFNDKPIVKNAVTCGICQSPADHYSNMFVCQANPNHLGDLNVGTFSDLTPPESGITCPTCKRHFPSYPEFTAHIGNPTCANEIFAL